MQSSPSSQGYSQIDVPGSEVHFIVPNVIIVLERASTFYKHKFENFQDFSYFSPPLPKNDPLNLM